MSLTPLPVTHLFWKGLESQPLSTTCLCLQDMRGSTGLGGWGGHSMPLQLMFIPLCIVPDTGFWHTKSL